MEKFTAIVLAGGTGKRMHSHIHKQYLTLAGKPVLYYALKAFEESDITDIILVTGADEEAYCKRKIIDKYHIGKVKAIVPGGVERYHSVYAGLCAAEGADYVLIHDGARPLVSADIIKRSMQAVKEYRACVAGMPVKDTIKIAGIDISGDKGTNATKAMVSMVNNPNFVNDAGGVGIAGLRDGSVAAYFSGSWDYKNVKEILGDNFGAVQLPKVKIGGTDKQLKAFAGSKAVAVNPNCKYQQIAVALAKYLGGKEAQQSHYDLRSVIPCNTELLAVEPVKSDVLVTAQNNTFNNTAVIQPTVTGMNDYWTPAQNFSKSIVNGEITLDNAAEKTEEFYKLINTSIVK